MSDIFSSWPKSPGARRFWCVLAAALFTLVYRGVTSPSSPATLEALTTFSAPTPYQYRVLTPLLAWPFARLGVPLDWIYSVLVFAFSAALFGCFRRLLTHFCDETATLAGALGLLWPLLWNYCVLNNFPTPLGLFYPSDLPAICFYVGGVLCLLEGRHTAFFVVFTFAALNRETSLFLLFLWLLTQKNAVSARLFWGGAAAMALFWVASKIVLTWLFRDNGGYSLMEPQFETNLRFAASLFLHPSVESWSFFTVFGGVWWALFWVWREIPPFFRRQLWLVPLFLLTMMPAASWGEVRIYNELVPIVFAPVVVGLAGRLSRKTAPDTPARQPSN